MRCCPRRACNVPGRRLWYTAQRGTTGRKRHADRVFQRRMERCEKLARLAGKDVLARPYRVHPSVRPGGVAWLCVRLGARYRLGRAYALACAHLRKRGWPAVSPWAHRACYLRRVLRCYPGCARRLLGCACRTRFEQRFACRLGRCWQRCGRQPGVFPVQPGCFLGIRYVFPGGLHACEHLWQVGAWFPGSSPVGYDAP